MPGWDTPVTASTKIIRASASFTRPADTTAYASGDLVANSTTAGSVVPLSFIVGSGGRGGIINRAIISKTNTSVTNAQFRVHIYEASPTCANGDNSAWSTNKAANYIDYFAVTADRAFTDGANGNGVASTAAGSFMSYAADTLYVLLEARAGYTPTSGEVFTVILEVMPN